MKLNAAICAVALCLGQPALSTTLDTFTGFVGFGDSLSDAGRFGQLIPPSNGGRFTDGITWMEVLGNEFTARGDNAYNMALGGATAGPVNTNLPGFAFVDSITPRDPGDPNDIPLVNLATLSDQVASFAAAGFDSMVGDNPLVTILLGGNDFLQNPLADPLAVIQNIADGIVQTASLGAQFDSFMVANLPDFSVRPSLFYADAALKADIRSQSIGFNFLLDAAMTSLAGATGLEIEIFDLFSTADAAYQDAISAGVILDDTCVDSLNGLAPDPACDEPSESANYLFIDDVHPGDFAQSRWGAAAVAQVQGRLSPVPLPAGAVLLLTGVAVLAGKRARRA
ncbi:VPLPA-CTERM sorting domain-containing protein [Aliishimia ponticola]|uniref:VPLPA-CTERM sorting domain-containing protein n=1 Tax=Aliishimia ponticola TaxID=2499833 RepID=A0A4S4NDP7_9RHOB|nr:SGNH/GDSL hydrolase family protein [Aliishimia ponticola]THH36657.1 VPLPA-CTERM sorting domain-containing protein [Aliishimia ponticola]